VRELFSVWVESGMMIAYTGFIRSQVPEQAPALAAAYGEEIGMFSEADARDVSPTPDNQWETLAGVARGSLTPPQLQAVGPDTTRIVPHLTIANLRLPANQVQRRATEYANYARACGAQHSMRLWRTGYEQAVLALAREASHLDTSATCQALFWEQRGGEFWVSATFSQPARRVVH